MTTKLENFIQDVPNFPKPGINFKDVSPLLANPEAFTEAIKQMDHEWAGHVDVVVALDARGFLFGAPLALSIGVPLVMLRKKGKLPGETLGISYDLEYGSAEIEVQAGALEPGSSALIIDDLLATGGTARAACTLVEKAGAHVAGCAFVVELAALGGRDILVGHKVHSLVNYKE